jgi:hypothetical protein
MKNYDKTKVRIHNIYESTKGYEKSFVEYEDLATGKTTMLMMTNFMKRYGR